MSSPHFRCGDRDVHLDLMGDLTVPGFRLKKDWLFATGVPRLGCTFDL